MTPTDPLYASQWHFSLIGNIEAIWDDYSGNGVKVGVYDEGVDYNHADLAANYDASLHIEDDMGNPVDPFPTAGGAHGTACAGLIAMDANNAEGGVGVSHGATIAGVDIFDSSKYGFINDFDTTEFMHSVSQATNFDVMSNSWGSTPNYSGSQNLNTADDGTRNSFATQLNAEYDLLSEMGRGGLGTIIVQASGNDNRNANGSGTNASRFTISVAATEQDGTAASYTNYGAAILVAAPAAAVTTDITGAPGYDPGDYTTGFNGTSAATPVVAGVTSLMLEANSELGWRDVHRILAESASLTGSSYGAAASGFEDGAWYSTNSGNWNGGGHALHDNYGFGMVNAFAAVRMAEVWHVMTGGPAVSSGSGYTPMAAVNLEQSAMHDSGNVALAFGDGNVGVGIAATDTQTVIGNVEIENIQLTLDFNFAYIGSVLEIFLIAPDGTRFEIVYQESYLNGLGSGIEWTFGITGALGMHSAGDWTIEITDIDGFGDTGTLNDWQLDFYGAAVSNDDIHTVTEDYMTVAGVDLSRKLNDTNGGYDWLNMVAIQGNIELDLGANVFNVDGIKWGDIIKNRFEAVALGDGHDTVTGNAKDNHILGMRGQDSLKGDDGNDTLDGGVGQDTLRGNDGDDSLVGGNGSDFLVGGNDNDTLEGGNQGDTLVGGNGEDSMDGGNGKDSMIGGDGSDTMTGSDGMDTMDGNKGFDSLEGGAGDDDMNGSFGKDTLKGGSGEDTLKGGKGNDKLLGGQDNDSLDGQVAADTLNGQAGDDTIEGGGGSDLLIGGSGDDDLHGGNGMDTLVYDGGDDMIFAFQDDKDTIELDEDVWGGGLTLHQVWNLYGSTVGGTNDVEFVFDANNSLYIEDGKNFGTLVDDMVIV